MVTNCPRYDDSDNTKFCYYDLSRPRYFGKICRRYWTEGKSTKPYSTSNKRSAASKSTVSQPQLKPDSYPIIDFNINTSQLSGGSEKNDLYSPPVFQIVDSTLNWRIHSSIDIILSKSTISDELYMSGMSGYKKSGQAVIAVGVGLNTHDKASVRIPRPSFLSIIHSNLVLVKDTDTYPTGLTGQIYPFPASSPMIHT